MPFRWSRPAFFVVILGSFLSSIHAATDLIPAGVLWRYLPGSAPASAPDATAWRQKDFADGSWALKPMPFYYGRPFTGTELADMRGGYTSVYLRRTFPVSDRDHVGELLLTVLSDDGFVAWINGHEVARQNVPDGELPHTATALGPVSEPVAFEEFSVPRPWEVLVEGDNVLCIQAFNAAIDGADFALDARLAATIDTAPPIVTEVIPPAGSTVDELLLVEVFFSEPVQGVTADDLLVNGTPATDVTIVAPGNYEFTISPPAAGTVQFTWSDSHGITDLLGQGHPFVGSGWSMKLDPAVVRKNLMISEFMADNSRSVYDDDCDNPDWIELYNSGENPINLQGWALTDDPADLGKWRFPDHDLAGRTYMIVFASQKNKTVLPTKVTGTCKTKPNAFAGFHTNFKLNPDGDYLALVAPDGEVVSEFAPMYPPQRRDVSYGLVPGAANTFAYFAQPTPVAPNSASGADFTPAVAFSPPGGTFIRPFALALTCDNAAAQIQYTLDGSFPNETNKNLLTYVSPIIISNTVQVRARASAPGLVASAPASETYLALTNRQDHLNSFTSSLPIIVMTTLKNVAIGASRNTTVHFDLFEPRDGLTTLLSRPTLSARGAAKIRGSSTLGEPQSNFAIQWADEFDQDLKLPVLGMPTDSEWVLYAPNEFDPPLIHNPFTMELSRQMNSPTMLTRFVEVYLNHGGPIRSNDWNGVYVLMQKPGLAPGRVDAPKAQPEDVDFPNVTGSYMFKIDRGGPGDTGFPLDGSTAIYVEPKEKEMKSPQRAPQLAYLKQYFADMGNALKLSNPKFRDPVVGYPAYLEITNWIDYHILETLSGQVDAIRLSSYFYKRRNGKIEYGPRWDYDRAWESAGDSRDDNPRVWDTGGGLFGPPWWPRVLADRDAWQLWCDRWTMFRQGALSRSNMYAVIDHMTNEVRFVQPREAKKWRNTTPRTSYANEIRIMKGWISNRVAWIDSQFASPPVPSSGDATVSPGFQVSIALPASISAPGNVTIFYTLDGSDPRPPVGTNTPTSFTYTGPITITTNTRVVARIRDTGRQQRSGPPVSTPWSAPVAATFIVTPPPLVLTELMFNPAPPPADSPWNAGDFEFLELKNITDQPVSLVGYHFVAGIIYRFTAASAVTELAPGARVLVVRNLAAFLSRYPGITSIAGEFTGNLADEGDRLALNGPVEEPIFDFHYGDHWQPVADGPGFSLVLRDEATPPGQLGDATKWRASAAEGGSPDLADAAGIASPPVFVNEVLAYPPAGSDDAIELYNPGNASVDISGWWLTDNFQEPKKHRVAAGTVIPAAGYLVVRESAFGQGDVPFGLSATGDSAWLFAVDHDGNLTGSYHGFSFGPSEQGVTFGREVAGDGSEQFVAETNPTPGAANAGARIGPVIFSELALARSAAGVANGVRDEFLELRSVDSQPVSLFDALEPDLTWHLRGDVDFDFPGGVTIPPAGHLLIVGFDPARDIYELAAFRARYGLDVTTPVFGPWHGVLDLSGGSLRLNKPGVPNPPSGERGPTILVEEVQFRPAAPWPVAGFNPGQSLVRRSFTGLANDAANWAAAEPTPGDDDADLDGLGDKWEIANGLNPTSAVGDDGPDGDPDGDGFSNRLEARNHTAPRDPASVLRLGAYLSSPNLVNFTLAAPAGHEFTLEYREQLDAGSWQTLRSVTAPPEGSIVFTTESATATARYFRLVQP